MLLKAVIVVVAAMVALDPATAREAVAAAHLAQLHLTQPGSREYRWTVLDTTTRWALPGGSWLRPYLARAAAAADLPRPGAPSPTQFAVVSTRRTGSALQPLPAPTAAAKVTVEVDPRSADGEDLSRYVAGGQRPQHTATYGELMPAVRRGLAALFEDGPTRAGDRVRVRATADLCFGAAGFWPWRVLPHEDLDLTVTVLGVAP